MAEQEFIAGQKKTRNNSLFNNKLFIFFISLLCSLVVWSIISMYETPEKERIFQDVKVQMTLTDTVPGVLGMTVFGSNEFYCDVTVKGKSYLVNDTLFTSDKIVAKPELEDIREPGVYEVPLKVQLVNSSSDLSVISVEPEYVTVYFDTAVEKEFPLVDNISRDFDMAEGCSVIESKINRDTVTIVGPSLEMKNIKEVKAGVAIEGSLSKTIQVPCIIDILADGKEIEYASVKESEKDIHLDIKVVQKKTFTLTVDLQNCPETLATECYLNNTDDTLTLDVPTEDETLMNSDSLCVATLDLSQLSLRERQNVTVQPLVNPLYDDMLPETLDVTVYMEIDGWTEQEYTVNIRTLSGEYANVTIPGSIASVIVVMPETEAAVFAADKMYAVLAADAMKNLTVGENTVYARIVLPDTAESAWVSGTYAVSVVLAESAVTVPANALE